MKDIFYIVFYCPKNQIFCNNYLPTQLCKLYSYQYITLAISYSIRFLDNQYK